MLESLALVGLDFDWDTGFNVWEPEGQTQLSLFFNRFGWIDFEQLTKKLQRWHCQTMCEFLKEAGILCPKNCTYPAIFGNEGFDPTTEGLPSDANEDDFYFIEPNRAMPSQYASGFDRSFVYHATGPKSTPHVLWTFTARGGIVTPILAKIMSDYHGYYVSVGDDQGNFFALAAKSGKRLLTLGTERQKESVLDCYIEENFHEHHGCLAVTREGNDRPLLTTFNLNELPNATSRDLLCKSGKLALVPRERGSLKTRREPRGLSLDGRIVW